MFCRTSRDIKKYGKHFVNFSSVQYTVIRISEDSMSESEEHYYRTLLLNIITEHYYKILLQNFIAERYYRTVLQNTITEHY